MSLELGKLFLKYGLFLWCFSNPNAGRVLGFYSCEQTHARKNGEPCQINTYFFYSLGTSQKTRPHAVNLRKLIWLIESEIWSFFFLLFFFGLFRAALVVYGGFQARGWIGATAAGLHHRHSNAKSELHLQTIPKLVATPCPWPTEWGQGLNLHPCGY